MDEPVNPDDRWASEDWNSYELYEKVRVRLRRKRMLMFMLVTSVFLGLCSIPVVSERRPKWDSLSVAREAAIFIETLKLESQKKQRAVRVKLLASSIRVEDVDHCEDVAVKSSSNWDFPETTVPIRVLETEAAIRLGVGLSVQTFCFDPVEGFNQTTKVAIVFLPVRDLAENELHRASYVFIEGTAANITLN